MDRVASHGCFGLSMAWLSQCIDRPGLDKFEHMMQKERLSSADGLQHRQRGRRLINELAQQHGPTSHEAAVVRMEAGNRDGDDGEPVVFICPAIRWDIVSGLASDTLL